MAFVSWAPTLGLLIFCASAKYLAKRGVPLSTAQLADHDAVLYGKTDGTTSLWSIKQDNGSTHVIQSEGRIIVGHSEAQVETIKAGFGIAQ